MTFMTTKLLLPAVLILAAIALAILVFVSLDTSREDSAAVVVTDSPEVTAVVPVKYADLSGSVAFDSVSEIPSDPAEVVRTSLAADTANQPPLKDMVLEVIEDATVTYDVQGLTVLAPLLHHRDPEIREAALEGIIQLGETAGAKTLREAARRAKDPQEVRRLIEAAEFLELPEYQP
jgi:hypothetical protein